MAEELRQLVAKQIEEAFADTPYPGDDNIGWGCGSEGDYLEKAFQGKLWKELSLELILEHRDQLPCTTPEGFRYYLPAWMLTVLFHYEIKRVDILYESLISNLAPRQGADMKAHFLHHVGKFNSQEKASILLFLEGIDELYPDERQNEAFLPPTLRKLSQAIEFWKNAQ